VQALIEWKTYCDENAIQSEFVFPTLKGNMRTYSGLRSMLKRFIEKHGLEDEGITLYTFRHTFATMLFERKENPKIIALLRAIRRSAPYWTSTATMFPMICSTIQQTYWMMRGPES